MNMLSVDTEPTTGPSILAPAGNKASFLAAIAAGADGIYCGLKTFSARMEAKNFTVEQLVPLARLAHRKGTKVYVALNSLLKPSDLDRAGRLLQQLSRLVRPDAVIIQDLSLVQLARQTAFSGELHLSTLANVGFSKALKLVRKLGIRGVVVPRELSIDEVKALALACPDGLALEVFVHGALCYGVSGTCYWSSFLGGKSGLRGRCVQPCRRLYTQKRQTMRFFSCQDLSVDVLTKVLLSVPEVRTWKIEGRKKGPHYVFNTVKAYQVLRDLGSNPAQEKTMAKRTALQLLSHALGRPGTHYRFLPQRPQNPVRIDKETGSGLFLGRIKGTKKRPYLTPGHDMLPGDVLRLGYEDESQHSTYRVKKYVPKRGRLDLRLSLAKGSWKGTPVFLVDRRERRLEKLLAKLEGELAKISVPKVAPPGFRVRLPKRSGKKMKALELHVYRKPSRGSNRGRTGLWLSEKTCRNVPQDPESKLWWWLPPVIWPEEEKKLEDLVRLVISSGGGNFVINAPWQVALFPTTKALNIWAGPFCNLANTLAISTLESLGLAGAIVSPELGGNDYLLLPKHSPLPLGIVVWGNWPLSVSRILSENLNTDTPFTSPKGEQAWVRKYGSGFWVYPNWTLDIRAKQDILQKAGYSLFVYLVEPLPRQVRLKKRPGLWNWDLGLA